jgi:hypothetical protein
MIPAVPQWATKRLRLHGWWNRSLPCGAFAKNPLHLRLEQLEPRNLPSLFAPAVNYPVGNNPLSVAVGDFDRDGTLDLAVADHNDQNVSILLGNGDGTFRSGGTFATNGTPIFVVAADLRHDGKLDLITGNEFHNDISVLLGNGDGTFQSPVNYATGSETVGVAVGDFNGDGIPDLAVASQGPGEVFVLLGNGDGTFNPAVGYVCGTFAREVAVGDLNGDGKEDLVVDNQGENTVSVLFGNGDGTFQPGVKYPTGPDPTSVIVGDLRDNGILDIVTGNFDFGRGTGSVSILLGNGDGTFQAAQNYTTDLHADSVALADFNGDGHLDMAVANSGSDDVSILLGNGDGTFQSAQNFAAGSLPSFVATGDFNAKGVQSLAVPNGNSNNVSILINNSTGALPSLTPNSIPEGTGDFTLTVNGGPFSTMSTVEWNGTPLSTTFVSSSELQATVPAADVADEGTASVSVVGFGATGPLKFSILDNDALSATGYDLRGMEGQAVNGIVATFTDVTYPTNSPDDFTATINWGDGTSSAGLITAQGNLFVVRDLHTYYEEGSYSIKVTINDDGGAATATTSSTATIATTLTDPTDIVGHASQTGQLLVAISSGSNHFTNAVFGALSTAVTWVDLVTGDFNGDGKTDIAARVQQTGFWWVGINTGSAFALSRWGQWSTAVNWVDVKVGDFTGDGKDDIAGRVQQTGRWWVALSNGSTAFISSRWGAWPTTVTWVDVNVGDFNGDGKEDITGRVLQTGRWWTGLSSGSSFNFTVWDAWPTTVTWVDVNVGDFNGDGLADITGRVLQTGHWWVGLSNGSTAFTSSSWGAWPTTVTWVDVKVGDFNDDGSSDLIGRALETGQWYVELSLDRRILNNPPCPSCAVLISSAMFSNSLWDTWSTSVTWVDVNVGDFNGDGEADITGRVLQTGRWWTGLSTGSSFSSTVWGQWATTVTWVDVRVGDFA